MLPATRFPIRSSTVIEFDALSVNRACVPSALIAIPPGCTPAGIEAINANEAVLIKSTLPPLSTQYSVLPSMLSANAT